MILISKSKDIVLDFSSYLPHNDLALLTLHANIVYDIASVKHVLEFLQHARDRSVLVFSQNI
jgi:hypothetical protein